MKLRAKVTLGVVVPLLLILGTFTIIEYIRLRDTFISNLSLLAANSGKVIEKNLRHAMLESDFVEMQNILDSISDTEVFRIVYLLDLSGKVIFAPNSEGVGIQFNNSQPDCQPCHKLPPRERPSSVIVTADDGQSVFRSMYPIENSPSCSTCHDPSQRLIGLLLTDIPFQPMEAALVADLRENLIWWAITILITIVVVNSIISQIVIRRLEGLANAFTLFGEGKLHFRLTIDDPDEIGQLADSFNKMGQRIESETAKNRNLSENLRRQNLQRGELLKRLITAQEDERKRVARELHDDLGQALSALSLQTRMMEQLVAADPERVREQLRETQSLVSETTDRMYDLILALRPSVLDDLGLVAALKTHAERFLVENGIDFEINAHGFPRRIAPTLEIALYRIFQEALSNVRRHSGAKNVQISLSKSNDYIEGVVLDDGQGFDPESILGEGDTPCGLGLLGMQERAAQCSGQLEINSQPGKGTRLRIRIPLEGDNVD